MANEIQENIELKAFLNLLGRLDAAIPALRLLLCNNHNNFSFFRLSTMSSSLHEALRQIAAKDKWNSLLASEQQMYFDLVEKAIPLLEAISNQQSSKQQQLLNESSPDRDAAGKSSEQLFLEFKPAASKVFWHSAVKDCIKDALCSFMDTLIAAFQTESYWFSAFGTDIPPPSHFPSSKKTKASSYLTKYGSQSTRTGRCRKATDDFESEVKSLVVPTK